MQSIRTIQLRICFYFDRDLPIKTFNCGRLYLPGKCISSILIPLYATNLVYIIQVERFSVDVDFLVLGIVVCTFRERQKTILVEAK